MKAKDLENTQEIVFLIQLMKNLETENKRLNEEMQKKENVPLNFEAENLQLRNNNNNSDFHVGNALLKGENNSLRVEYDPLLKDRIVESLKSSPMLKRAKDQKKNVKMRNQNIDKDWDEIPPHQDLDLAAKASIQNQTPIQIQENENKPNSSKPSESNLDNEDFEKKEIESALFFEEIFEKKNRAMLLEESIRKRKKRIQGTFYGDPDQIGVNQANNDIPVGQGSNRSMTVGQKRAKRRKEKNRWQNKKIAESAIEEKETKNEEPR